MVTTVAGLANSGAILSATCSVSAASTASDVSLPSLATRVGL